jgi:trimeric autotransporter adhesin
MKKITQNYMKLFLSFFFLFVSTFSFSQIAQRGTATTATSTGITLTINKPTGIVVGDIMIANIAKGGNNSTAVTSAGWTLIDGQNLGGGGTQRYGAILYKIAVFADLSTTDYTFALGNNTDSSAGAIIAFSGVDSTTPFDVASGTLTLTNANTASGSTKTTVTADTAIIMLSQTAGLDCTWSGWSTTSPGALTELFDNPNGSNTKSSVGGAWAIKNSIGATGAGTVTLSGSQRNGAILLALRPTPVACTTYSLTSTSVTTPICAGATTSVTLSNSVSSGLPTGTYTVTYNLGAPNAATGLTATMTVSTAGTGTFTTASLANAGATGITITNLTNGSCSSTISTANTATITVNAAPTANAGGALSVICQNGTTVVLGGSFGGSATSAIWSTTSGGTFTNNTGSTPNTTTWTPPGAFVGTATLILTTSGGLCTNATASKTQVVNAIPTVTIGSALAAICQGGTTVALGGSFGGSATSAVWSTTSGGTFANNGGATPNTATWTPPAGFTGTATLILTTAGGSCGIVTNSKTQVVNLAPTANAGSALTTICQGGTTVALGGSFGGAATSAVWSTTSGGTFTNNTGSTPGTTTWTPPGAFVGTATLILTTSGGSCSPTVVSKTQVVSGPTVNAGPALATICQGGTSVALGGSFGGSATGAIWSDGGIGGTFANNSGATPGTATWTPPALYLGTATLTLTTIGGSCGSVNTSKTQTVATGSFATVGSAMTITGSLTSTSLGGNTPSVGSGTWTKISGPTGTVTFSNASSGTSTATVPSIGTYVFRWTITSTCGTSFAEITVTYLDANQHRNYTLFYEDFDATNGGWTNTTSTNGSWLWTDSFPSVSEIGENSFWRINNFNDYANNAAIEIESPVYNFTGYENLLFNIDIRYDTENNRDGMRILYSINNGAYVQLGANGNGVNWYNSTSVTALGGNGWSNDNATASLAFTPVGVGANRFLKASLVLDDATFRNQANVRFKVEFKSDGGGTDNGVAFDNVSVEGEPMVILLASPIAPAKVNQNLRLWFKSNAGISAIDGTPLTEWEDQAYDITRPDLINKESVKALVSDAPTYRDNPARNINFNPVVDFNATNKDYMNGKGGLYSQDYFVVVYSDDIIQNTTGTSGRQIPVGGKSDEQSFHEDPTGLGLGNTTARYNTPEVIAHNVGAYAPGSGSPTAGVDSYGRAFSSTTVTYNEPLIINVKTNANGTQTEIYKNGVKIDNTAGRTGDTGTGNLLNFYEYKNLPFYLGTGRSGISGRAFSALNGRLSEVVVYTAPNSALNQQKIQSYLGIKYGVTLHATGSTNDSGVSTTTRLNDVNYIDSAGSIIWNTTANAGYNYDIAGIGRDDDSQLYQKQSKTVNTTDDITIGLSTIEATNNLNTGTCNDKHFLVWGNNQGTLAAQPAVVVNMSSGITPTLTSNVEFVSVGRTWKVVETGGNMPTTKVSIPTIMLSATLTPPGDYLMFISDTPVFNPTAEYRVMTANGSNLETLYDFDGTKYITFGFAPERTFVRSIAFDGVDDYLDAGKVLNLNTSFTVSSWVKRNSTNQTILSKRDNAFTTGYDLGINAAGKAEMQWMNGSLQTITSTATIPSGIWHNIAVTYDGSTAKMYIDGVLDVTQSMSTVPANTESFLIAAADGVNTTSFFNGNIDEVRVWGVALTDKQLRYVMNQEIDENATLTGGTTIPNTITSNDISAIPWSNLSAYYPMSTYTYTNAKDISNNNYTAALRNLTTVDRQTAPLPYESVSNGQWQTAATWLNNTVQYLPNSLSIVDGTTPINWNIVKTYHNISSTGNKEVLGLFVEANTIDASNDSKIEVSHYLKLNGKIDLVDKSQLVQPLNSDLDPTSSGSIERDQQGTKNVFNYNYWSSPVGTINNTTNNNSYSVSGVMKDGTTTTPQDITWTSGLSGSPTNPITLSSYWIFKFQNLTPLYANWTSAGPTGLLNAGQGYTLKGSGAVGPTQNYTFVGKPNNGTITSSIAANNLNLSGNPYASAIDATQFINDNNTSITGALYFWEHATNNATHNTAGYQGGYSARNLTGGVPPVAPAGIAGLGTSVKIPNRYIPVGQGFFVTGSATGGTVTFNNGQRLFVKEDNASLSNYMFKNNSSASLVVDHFNNNSEDVVPEDSFKKIRLGYQSADNFYKQALLGFMESNATDGLDYGYDAINIDSQVNDLYFQNSGVNLNIQGVGNFDVNAIFPIGIKNNVAGNVVFQLDDVENFDNSFEAFIHDNQTGIYHNVRNVPVTINLPSGTINNRFSLRFKNDSAALGNEDFNLSNGIQVAYANTTSILNIKNYVVDTTVESVALFNLLGQAVGTWDIENQNQQDIQLPITKLSTGTYIVKVKTDKGETSRKIIIK